MKTVVISGINIVDGGAKSVYDDLLDTIVKNRLYENEKFIILVSKKELFKKYIPFFEIIEFPKSKISWLNRIYYEYFYFKKLSKRIKPDIWLSMHDITPNVIAKKQYVYCHNPSPFYNMKFKDAKYGWKYYLFSKFYKYLYKINIYKTTAVIVQQEWIAREFKRLYHIPNIIVARPSIIVDNINVSKKKNDTMKFIYPSFPRPFKNFESLCKAVAYLNQYNSDYIVYLTLDGKENNYAKMLKERYGHITNIKFIGLLSRKKLYDYYSDCDCLVFLSKLETWGMPISEFKQTGKSIIVSDLPYAHESVDKYENACFVSSNDYKAIAEAMLAVIKRKKFYNKSCNSTSDDYWVAKNWNELIEKIF